MGLPHTWWRLGRLGEGLSFREYSSALARELESLGFQRPTAIQLLAQKPILEGENVLLVAPTGSGKTEAAVFPVFESLLRVRGSGGEKPGIKILYITPLRALNRDIFRRLKELGRRLGVKVEVRHGDTPAATRRIQALKPPDMLITTPETLQAILPGKRMRRHLKAVRWVIVDEVHEVLCDKRGAQLALSLERLRRAAGEFQRIGLSATLGSPEEAGRFLAGAGRSFKVLEAESFRNVEAQVESPHPTREDLKRAEEYSLPPGAVARIRRLVEASELYRSTLVFTNTREHAEALAVNLRRLYPKLSLGVHHGSLSREARIEAEEKLKEGFLRVLICTSSLELGIDIGAVDLVIQYHSPRQSVRLVQRLGRSGHRIGGTVRGLILASWPDDILEAGVLLRRALEGWLEGPIMHREALDVLAHQLVGLALDLGGRVSLEAAYKVFRRAEPFRRLEAESLYAVASQLEAEGKIRLMNGNVKVRVPGGYRYYFESLSTIPEVSSFLVVDYAGRRVGSLDQEFVVKHGKPGSQFILKGSVWQILRVDEERRLVEVEPVEPSPAAVPAWEGEVIPVPFEAALEVGELRRRIGEELTSGGDPLNPLKRYPISEDAREKTVLAVKEQLEEGFPVPSDRLILVENFENYALVHGCFGDRVNRALSRLLAALVTARMGVEVAVQSDPYRLALISPRPLDPYFLAREIEGLKAEDARGLLEAVLDQTELFNWRLWNNAKRFGVVSRGAEYRLREAQMLLKALKGTPVYRETLREIFLEDLDLENLGKVLAWIRSGNLKVEVAPQGGKPSPLALPLLDKIAPHDLLRPAFERGEALEILKARIASKLVRLFCAYQGDWETLRKVENVPEKPRCPRCGSTLIAVLNPQDRDSLKAARKKLSGRKLSREEERLWLSLWRNASLVQNYGKRAVIVMAARGIGPATAVRLLRQPHRSENELYQAILKAEREYLRTRIFWD
ncbi:MAG: helicase [Candidatus Hecatellales archaeon B24]|nr:MAG: helicase [Candidatus Hecatellales archaeon B24]